MVMFELEGRITEDGKLQLELPDELHPGSVRVIIETAGIEGVLLETIPPFEKRNGAEIVHLLQTGELDTAVWLNITGDPVDWLEQLREREQKARWQREDK